MEVGTFLAFFPISCAAFFDFKQHRIPDWTVFLLLCCAAFNIAAGQAALLPSMLGFLAAGCPLWLIAAGGNDLGGGDVKLCAALGALLGLEQMLVLLALALLALIISGKLQKKRCLPFAPYVWGVFYMLLAAELIQRS